MKVQSDIDKPFVVFGGTFNPIHCGHISAASNVSEHLGKLPIRLVLAAQPRLKHEEPISSQHRWHMLQLACEDNPLLIPDDVEVRRGGTTRTIDTVILMNGTYDSPVVWLIGDEAAERLPQWIEYERLRRCASFIVLVREGHRLEEKEISLIQTENPMHLFNRAGYFSLLDLETPSVSSSAIRECFKGGQEPHPEWLHPHVSDYIIKNRLYSS